MIAENVFFKEVALRICSSLDIEKALWRCYLYMQGVLPVDALTLTFYDADSGILEVAATANDKGGTARSDKILIPPPLRKELEEPDKHPLVRMAANIHTDPIALLVAQQVQYPYLSVMVARFIIEGKFLGSLNVHAAEQGSYTAEHLRLLGLVNEPFAVALANCRRYLEMVRLKEILADNSKYFENELRNDYGDVIVGAESGLKAVMEQVASVAPSCTPVLLHGETGTGKEVIANAIHMLSPRAQGPLIKVNCGAIPESLIDSELFGHEKGAFTGAQAQKRGRFERANQGTIFLDEVSELPLNAQVRLLRVLQEKEIERVGGTIPIKVNIRIISATNRDLVPLIKKQAFRDDLYYRLGVFPIHIPPLRQRKADIPSLVTHFIKKKAAELGFRFVPILASGALDVLTRYEWPGNIRELSNTVERALLLYKANPLKFDDILGLRILTSMHSDVIETDEDLTLHAIETKHIRRVLDMTRGRIEGKKGAASILKINPGTLRHKMRKLGVPFGRAVQGAQVGSGQG
jgi:transcriptional regulator with GAF, ATPase, and Fis domain